MATLGIERNEVAIYTLKSFMLDSLLFVHG